MELVTALTDLTGLTTAFLELVTALPEAIMTTVDLVTGLTDLTGFTTALLETLTEVTGPTTSSPAASPLQIQRFRT